MKPNPGYGSNSLQRTARVHFYTKNGALKLNDVVFILPPLQTGVPTEMLLMIIPAYKLVLINKSIIQQFITDMYLQVYNRAATDKLVLAATNKLPGEIIIS